MLTPKMKFMFVALGAVLVAVVLSVVKFSNESLLVQTPLNNTLYEANLYRESPLEKFDLGQFIVERRGNGILKDVNRDLFSIYKNNIKLTEVNGGDFNEILGNGQVWKHFEPFLAFNNNVYFLGICPGSIWGVCEKGAILKFNVDTKKIEKVESPISNFLESSLNNKFELSGFANSGRNYTIAIVDRKNLKTHTYPTRWDCSLKESICQDIVFFR
ncbi:MAG: hypothetical protein QMD65_00010 [Patescibacteria group bacterium]|nr:hypothetical protein [Patescibacteria group bacterium]